MWQWLASSFNGATPAAGAAGATTNAVAAAGSPAAGAATTAAGKWYESPKFIEFLGNAARFGASIAPENQTAQMLGGLGYDMGQSKLMARNNNRMTAPQQRPLGTAPAGAPAPGASTATLPPVGSMGGAPAPTAPTPTSAAPSPLASTAPGNTWADYARSVLGFNGGSQSAPEAAPDFTGLSADNQQAVMRAFLAQQGMAMDERNTAIRTGMDLYQNDQANARQEREFNQPKPYFNDQGGFIYDPQTRTFKQQFTAPQQPKFFDLSPGSQVVGIDPTTGERMTTIQGPPQLPKAPNYQLVQGQDGNFVWVPEPGATATPGAPVPAGVKAPEKNSARVNTEQWWGKTAEDAANRDPAVMSAIAAIESGKDASAPAIRLPDGNPNPDYANWLDRELFTKNRPAWDRRNQLRQSYIERLYQGIYPGLSTIPAPPQSQPTEPTATPPPAPVFTPAPQATPGPLASTTPEPTPVASAAKPQALAEVGYEDNSKGRMLPASDDREQAIQAFMKARPTATRQQAEQFVDSHRK